MENGSLNQVLHVEKTSTVISLSLYVLACAGFSGVSLHDTLLRYINSLRNIGVVTRALVCDGHPSNVAACKKLGFKLDPDNLKECVEIEGESVHMSIDYIHAVKLLRNLFADQPFLLDVDGKKLEFGILKKLDEIQQKEGLRLANKLSVRHINFQSQDEGLPSIAALFSVIGRWCMFPEEDETRGV
jgi:hypothetical protein